MSPVTASSRNPESLALRRGGEPIITADEIEPLRVFGRGGQRRRQLQRSCRPQRVKPKQSDRAVHRASRRSATISSLALAPAVSRTREASRKASTSRGVRGGTATPRRMSSAAPRSAPRLSPRQGSIRATGFPRCVINTASPRRTSPGSPLRALFASLMLARLMWPFLPCGWCLSSVARRIRVGLRRRWFPSTCHLIAAICREAGVGTAAAGTTTAGTAIVRMTVVRVRRVRSRGCGTANVARLS